MKTATLGQKNNPAPEGRPEASFDQYGYNNTVLSSQQAEALRLVKFEKTQWETAFAYVTERVAFNMRMVIRQCRKNYWGVYDQEIDPTTGRAKIWEHLTKTFVDYVVAAYDLDTKDINFRAKHPDAIPLTSVVRSIVKNKLDGMGFGEQLDLALRQLAIDGTIVWEVSDDAVGSAFSGTDEVKIKLVDLLNFYIDPTVDSIAQAESVIERIVLTKTEFDKLAADNDWENKDIVAKRQVARYDSLFNPGYVTNSDITYVEIYRRRGWAPEYILTGNMKDVDLIPTEIICSGTGGQWIFHKATKREDNRKKGYEEAWLNRVHGRWYGEGVAERLIQKQNNFNIISNIRVNRAYLSQLGIFLVRKGAGITPQMLSRLAANGAISVTNLETDIKQFQMNEASEASYKDEENIYQWAQRYTGATDVINGEPLPASTPATNASIQNSAAKSRFQLAQEGIGMFLQRWMKNQALKVIFAQVKEGDLVRMHFDSDQLQSFIDQQVNSSLADYIDEHKKQKILVNPMKLELEKQKITEELKNREFHFVELLKKPDIFKYDVEIYVTNEEFDKAITLSNLQQITQTLAAIQGTDPKNIYEIIKESLDIMGLDSTRFNFNTQQQLPGAGGQNPQSQLNGATGITPNQPRNPRVRSQNLAQTVAPTKTMEPQMR